MWSDYGSRTRFTPGENLCGALHSRIIMRVTLRGLCKSRGVRFVLYPGLLSLSPTLEFPPCVATTTSSIFLIALFIVSRHVWWSRLADSKREGYQWTRLGLPIWVFRVGVHAPLICTTNRPLPFCSRRRKSFARERKISNYTNGARYFLRSSNLANKRNFISQANFFLIDSIGWIRIG